MNGLQCGACQKDMASTDELTLHLEECPAAKALLFPVTKLLLVGESRTGHPLGSLVYLANKNSYLISRYASAIANDMNSLERAKIHHLLCEKLALDYNNFKPFESEAITEIPTQKEAEDILWAAIGVEMRRLGLPEEGVRA